MSTLELRVRSLAETTKQSGISSFAPRRTKKKRARILIVTPELNSSSSEWMRGGKAPRAKAGGLADMCTMLVDSLGEKGVDVHIAMPHFRRLFREEPHISRRIHLCQDREFFYRRSVYEGGASDNRKAALVFQRDVIHHVLPQVRPKIVHCHDWMTGLIPAAAKKQGIKSVFTIHNVHNEHVTLAEIEDRGIDAARIWDDLYYENFPESYFQSRSWNRVSLLPSAVHSADYVNTVSQSFLDELLSRKHTASECIVEVLAAKHAVGRASGILNAPDSTWTPTTDPSLAVRYGAHSHEEGKQANKAIFQRECGLEEDHSAPLLFWPSRLDPIQKGCQLFADILYRVVSDYYHLGLQVVFVADGPYRKHFENIADFHGLRHRIAVLGFNEVVSRRAFAASDFVLMPSSYEPCGLSQMVGLKYGSLPIVYKTGGLRDSVEHLSDDRNQGNGFVFETHDANGLKWAIDEALRFYQAPLMLKRAVISRIMRDSHRQFSPEAVVKKYTSIYEELLETGIEVV